MAQSRRKVEIQLIPTGVPNLDVVLGGGIPAYSINVIAGAPGAGKSTLAQQIIFHNATAERRALHFAVLSEPLLKMVRYQQQFDFFDPDMLNTAVFLFDIGSIAVEKGLRSILETIRSKIAEVRPSFLVIDSIKALQEISSRDGRYTSRAFLHDLSTLLAGAECTSFLVGEYAYEEMLSLPEFSGTDGILWLAQDTSQNSVVRRLQVMKCRGQAPLSGRHSFRISSSGLEVFPRALPIPERSARARLPEGRAAFGISGLDQMMSSGIPVGETCLVAGSSGTGKTLLSLHFVVEGARLGQPSVMVTFEEHPLEHERKAKGFGWDLRALEDRGLLRMIYLRPIDISVDEVLHKVHEATRELKAKRVVLNSISGFELSLSPFDEGYFRESLYRLLATLTGEQVTTLLTTEVPDLLSGTVRVAPEGVSFLADNLLLLRYVEIESQLRKAVMVVKMRTSPHDKELRQYQITSKGIIVEQAFTEYAGILSGLPTLRTVIGPQPFTTGLTEQEEALMHVLLALPDSGIEQLADGMGLEKEETLGILDKLVDTGYAFRSVKDGKTTYRVALISGVTSTRRRR